ncbi:ABC transporter permease [Bifidobacterium canis]|uniref:ABC transporter permease n=1 Tax=Bifidobacterium canis TaxID=2610880 RepID=A0A7K1J5H1_9BIFI|nr:ABC transporter permease [Bifidobacterium canis]MUH59789.1 ABC transporter permease [Bifidobacterium canis]
MFIVRNALKNLWRNKGRNILIIIVVAIISAASTISFAIVQAAQHARSSALQNTQITAQISLNRNALIASSSKSSDSSSDKPDMSAVNKAMQEKQLTLADYQKYAKSEYGVASSYYIETSSAAEVSGSISTIDSSSSSSNNSSSSGSSKSSDSSNNSDKSGSGEQGGKGPGGDGGGMMMTSGDFSLVAFSSDEAIANAPNGTFTMSSGQVFGYSQTDDNEVLISKTLADANNLKVGSTFKIANVSDSSKTYTLKVVGIYENSSDSSSSQAGGPMASAANDSANAIYMSVATLKKLGLDSTKTLTVTDSQGNSRTTQAAQLSYTYVFSGKSDYDKFVADVKAAGLSSDYTVSSMDVEQYEQSLVPFDNLAKFAKTLLIVVLSVGAVVLIILTIFNIRERKYEIGVLTAIGVKKVKVAAQFAVELLTVVFVGLIIGTGIGAATSVPVSNSLLSSQVASQQTQMEQQRAQFGRDMQGGPGSQDSSSSSSSDSSSNSSQKDSKSTQAAPQEPGGLRGGMQKASSMISQVNATVNWATIGIMLLIGLALTLLASLTAAVFVMRYEPLQILADRS